MRILVFRGGALGDFIVTLPGLGLLRYRWPEAHIELVGNRVAAEVAVGRYYLDAAYSQHESRWAALYDDRPLPKTLEEFCRSFDLVINYWPDPDGTVAAHFARLGFAGPNTLRTYLSAPVQPALAPAARHYCQPLSALGLATEKFDAILHLKPEDYSAAIALVKVDAAAHAYHSELGTLNSEPRFALHCGSGSPRKNWPLDRWIELGRWLQISQGAHLLVIVGEAEETQLATLKEAFAGSPCLILQNIALPALAAILSRCRLFLGHDSGISHLAAAAGCPSLLLFGPSDPALWAPPGNHVCVVQKASHLDAIRVADVKTEIITLIGPSSRPT